ncbi:hypothetical protein Bca4012_065660 [Brassica carinata]
MEGGGSETSGLATQLYMVRGAETFAFDAALEGRGTETGCTSDATYVLYPYEEMRDVSMTNSRVSGCGTSISREEETGVTTIFFDPSLQLAELQWRQSSAPPLNHETPNHRKSSLLVNTNEPRPCRGQLSRRGGRRSRSRRDRVEKNGNGEL